MAKWKLDEEDLKLNDFDEYQQQAKETAIYPASQAMTYLALKLCGESGEVAEKIGKSIRDNTRLDDADLVKELGDVLWYVAMLAEELGYDFSEVAYRNVEKLKSRQVRGVLGGSGDNR